MPANDLISISERLRELEVEIVETCKRLPAHSVKPLVMSQLLGLEDERDLLVKRKKLIENKQ